MTWDGRWYLSIVRAGITPTTSTPGHPDFAFFPLWPIAIIAGSLFGLLDSPWSHPCCRPRSSCSRPSSCSGRSSDASARARRNERRSSYHSPPGRPPSTLAYSESLFVLIVAAALLVGVATRLGIVLVVLASLTRLVGPALSLAAMADLRSRPRLAFDRVGGGAGDLPRLVWVHSVPHRGPTRLHARLTCLVVRIGVPAPGR